MRAVLQNVQRFNDSFLDREEDAVIQLRTLEDAQVAARPERVQVRAFAFPGAPQPQALTCAVSVRPQPASSKCHCIQLYYKKAQTCAPPNNFF